MLDLGVYWTWEHIGPENILDLRAYWTWDYIGPGNILDLGML
jgi:hypothetical protein